MKRLLFITAALVAAVAILVAATIPRRRVLLAGASDGTISGVYHVHTNRSDGLSGPDEIAAAAARAGHKFVIFTDHGDGTRPTDSPTYRSGVLCIDGVEISTADGHYAAVGLSAAPYPLAGEARDVVDDVRRLGGFGIAAHPDSPKPELRWSAWDTPFDAIELTNLDTSWRVWAGQAGWRAAGPAEAPTQSPWRARRRLAGAVLDYPFRPAETIAALMQPSEALIAKWAAVAARRRVPTLAGVDAHARLGPGSEGYSLPFPGYETSFRTLSIHVTPDRPFSGNAQSDAAAVLRALRNGHLYSVVDAIATPPAFELSATNAHGTVHEGDEIAAGGGPVTLRIRSNAPRSFTTLVRSGTTIIATSREPELVVPAPEGPAVYWVEIRPDDRDASWLRSNPIYVRALEPLPPPPSPPPATFRRAIFDGKTPTGWRVEHDATSLAAVDLSPPTNGSELRFRFGLAGGTPLTQFAALASDTPDGVAASDRLAFTMRSERPMRISVQLRGGERATEEERWQRSVYVDTFDREYTIAFDDMRPAGGTRSTQVPRAAIRSILFVVDLTNTRPGTSERIWIKRVELQR